MSSSRERLKVLDNILTVKVEMYMKPTDTQHSPDVRERPEDVKTFKERLLTFQEFVCSLGCAWNIKAQINNSDENENTPIENDFLRFSFCLILHFL